ncbi:fumarylacetoacetate hydrolase family protein [Paraburkholderia sp. J63]|uniref:fumarylacetoacetate hydrolase family protein n=1 Tax=Paraburkholderia sp. J63 TaxID=2805434 RepID=UPI002ABDF591|nr:fumarylacetoacetate hydrolase family protein [Paraburkholderia sp. J63]
MKLMSFVTPQRATFGIVDGDRIFDLGPRLVHTCTDLKSVLCAGWVDRLPALISGAPADFRVDEVSFLPVLPNPSRIFCAGLNYYAHRAEGNRPETTEPPIFIRLAQSQTGHGRPLVCPVESDQLDFEGELAVVIGKAGRRIAEEDALGYVAGMSCYNDGSVRDWQLATTQWTAGKNFPATGAFGPWLVTADELSPARDLTLVTRLNGEEVQRTSTELMTFPMARLISFISTFTTLVPGDVIVTGTPGGVGLRRTPPLYMKHGDEVEVEIEGLGVLRNSVVKERARHT